jgi:hypothetical protein
MKKVIGMFEECAQRMRYFVDFERRVWRLTIGKN